MEARCIIIKGRRGVLKIDKKREMADIGSQMPAISRFWRISGHWYYDF